MKKLLFLFVMLPFFAIADNRDTAFKTRNGDIVIIKVKDTIVYFTGRWSPMPGYPNLYIPENWDIAAYNKWDWFWDGYVRRQNEKINKGGNPKK